MDHLPTMFDGEKYYLYLHITRNGQNITSGLYAIF